MHINLLRYGIKLVIPSEQTILDLSKVDVSKKIFEIDIILPGLKHTVKFDTFALLDEFIGIFTASLGNIAK